MNKKEILGLCEFLKLHGYENTDNISKFIFGLQQENQKYKEVIKKLKKWLRLQDILANEKNNPQTVSFKKILEYIEYLERKYNNE